jgi:hypothetical protein
MLTLNVQSVLAQTDHDIEQIFIVDNDQIGVPAANKSLALNKHRVEGDYVYILDDDTRLLDRGFVARLKLVAESKPDVIMVKSSRPQFAPHVLPKADIWRNPEQLRVASTNCLCYVIRQQMWLDHIGAFSIPAAGDWHFLYRLKRRGAAFAWLDLVVAETQQLGRGRLFEKCGRDWFQQVARKFGFEEVEPGDWRLSLYTRPKPEVQELRVQVQKVKQPRKIIEPRAIEIISVEHIVERPKVAHSLLSRRMKP